MPIYDVVYYEKSDVDCPVSTFIDEQTPQLQAKILRTIDLLATNGPDLREPLSKKLNDHIFELRCQTDGERARILYFFIKGRRIVLTHGFIKKTQKTPPKEIERAENYRRQHLNSTKK